MDKILNILNENFSIIICFYLLISLITMLMYKYDKLQAINGKYRVSEAKLLILPWLFGSLGGLLGMYMFRHKTKKIYFILNNFTSLIVHILLFLYIYTY
jgi:uncharacterized membrane protein YsdA (DUF1294 family)